jgi:transposase
MDPHKRSATIEVLDEAEQPLMTGRFGTDGEGQRRLERRWWTCRRS